jgi:hypothetical protein
VAEIVLDITTREAEIARERGDAARLVREEDKEIATKRHESGRSCG